MRAEEVKSLPRMGPRQYSRAISRIEAELHGRFWRPIAEMLDPYHQSAKASGAAQDFYSRGKGAFRPYEVAESLALMKSYLATPQLTFDIWFQLRPIYKDLLSEALTEADRDLIACAVREFVRLTLDQPTDHEYGLVDPSATDSPWYAWGDPCTDDEELVRCLVDDLPDYAYWGNRDLKTYLATVAMKKLLDDADEFVREFPRSAEHRLNMVRALQPIFRQAWDTNWSVTDDVLPYVKAMLAIDFREAKLASRVADEPVQMPTETGVEVPCLSDT
jgi:hypothetical protein